MSVNQACSYFNDAAKDAAFKQLVRHKLVDHASKTSDGRVVPLDEHGQTVLGSTEAAEALRRAAEKFAAIDSEDEDEEPLKYNARRNLNGRLIIDIRRQSELDPNAMFSVEKILEESREHTTSKEKLNKVKRLKPKLPQDRSQPPNLTLPSLSDERCYDDLTAMGINPNKRKTSSRIQYQQFFSSNSNTAYQSNDVEMEDVEDDEEANAQQINGGGDIARVNGGNGRPLSPSSDSSMTSFESSEEEDEE